MSTEGKALERLENNQVYHGAGTFRHLDGHWWRVTTI